MDSISLCEIEYFELKIILYNHKMSMNGDSDDIFAPMIGGSNRRNFSCPTGRGCYHGFVVGSLLLILVAHTLVIVLGFMYWNKIGHIVDEIVPIISGIPTFLTEARSDLQKFSSFADLLASHKSELELFLSSLGLIDRAAVCTLATHNCSW